MTKSTAVISKRGAANVLILKDLSISVKITPRKTPLDTPLELTADEYFPSMPGLERRLAKGKKISRYKLDGKIITRDTMNRKLKGNRMYRDLAKEFNRISRQNEVTVKDNFEAINPMYLPVKGNMFWYQLDPDADKTNFKNNFLVDRPYLGHLKVKNVMDFIEDVGMVLIVNGTEVRHVHALRRVLKKHYTEKYENGDWESMFGQWVRGADTLLFEDLHDAFHEYGLTVVLSTSSSSAGIDLAF